MAIAYLSLGSNMGDRFRFLKRAVENLNKAGVDVLKSSSVYETSPVGYTDQPDFLNAVLKVRTFYSPYQLLSVVQKVEKDLGRKRDIRWGPRTIDVDILLYDNVSISEEHLTIPHPEMLKRAFVLVPLREICPDIALFGHTVDYYIQSLKEQGIRRLPGLLLL